MVYLFSCIRQKGHSPGSFYRCGYLPLVVGTISGNPPGQNFPSFGNIPPKLRNFFIVNMFYFVCAKIALTSFFPFILSQPLSLLCLERYFIIPALVNNIDIGYIYVAPDIIPFIVRFGAAFFYRTLGIARPCFG